MIYADSSALVSLYSANANTHAVLGIFASLQPPVIFSQLHQLELSNAMELRQFRQQMTASQATASLQTIHADTQSGTLRSVSLNWPKVFSSAIALAQKHSRQLGTRSLDILHVAAALESSAVTFVTFDKRQADLARAEGLTVQGA